ncbi:MAG: L-seryl-tRNA(Sec) selenium transferase [Chthoniobacterales bacterium]
MTAAPKTSRRAIPAVGRVLEALGIRDLPRPLATQLVRQHLASLRRAGSVPSLEEIVRDIQAEIGRLAQSRLQPVINGTGIVLHTNFGRAPLAPVAVRRVAEIAASYNNLEYDITNGGRGSRAAYLERCLALACCGEAATVVNNGAAALVLMVRHFTKKKREVVISRGELVQIGGGFRVGEILEASGARLREVGATNQTTLDDYAAAIGPETAFVLRVHQSNFYIGGFTETPPNESIALLARNRRVPFVVDLGSGSLSATETLGLSEHEPTPAETLKQGAELVCFSGDKLLGGAQAGIIAGKKRLVAALKREPIFRALRCDKMVLAALEATVDLHLGKATNQLPALHLLSLPSEKLRARGETLLARLRLLPCEIRLAESATEIGGGALPRSKIDSIVLEISSPQISPNDVAAFLRKQTPPVVGCVANNRFKLDLRTIFPEQDELVAAALTACLTKTVA